MPFLMSPNDWSAARYVTFEAEMPDSGVVPSPKLFGVISSDWPAPSGNTSR